MSIDIFGIDSLAVGDRLELVQHHLLNLITSYSDEADVFTELIQNSIDAISRRMESEPELVGELTIIVGRRAANEHYIYVQDNGTGMTPDIVDKVCVPGFSTGKRKGKSIGYKGVGMSYVVAVSNHLALTSVSAGVRTDRTVMYAYEWVSDSEKPPPAVSDTLTVPELVAGHAAGISQGTGVYFAFHSGREPKSLDNMVIITDGIEKEVDNWASLLCARSPLGLATSTSEVVLRPLKVNLILDRGHGSTFGRTYARSKFDLSANPPTLGYPFPELVFRVGRDTSDIDKTADAQRSITHGRKYQAVFHEWEAKDLLDEMDNLDEEERNLLLLHLQWVRGYLCYSTDVLKQVRTMMGTRQAVVRYGARLAVDGVPQGRPLELALTSDAGLDRQTHIVVRMNEMELDTGRKFVSDERLLGAINKVNQRVVTKLKDYRWAMKIKDRQDVASDLASWVNSIASRAGNSVLPQLFEGAGFIPPARVNPENEQEVIALWTALLTTGMLPGYRMLALSGFNRYDAMANILPEALGGGPYLAPVSTDQSARTNAVVEFKFDFNALIDDFEKKIKAPQDIDLVVCWDCPDLSLRNGSLTPVYGPLWSHERPLRAVSYIWNDDSNGNSFHVVALKNVVAEILAGMGEGSGKAALDVLVNRDVEKLV